METVRGCDNNSQVTHRARTRAPRSPRLKRPNGAMAQKALWKPDCTPDLEEPATRSHCHLSSSSLSNPRKCTALWEVNFLLSNLAPHKKLSLPCLSGCVTSLSSGTPSTGRSSQTPILSAAGISGWKPALWITKHPTRLWAGVERCHAKLPLVSN